MASLITYMLFPLNGKHSVMDTMHLENVYSALPYERHTLYCRKLGITTNKQKFNIVMIRLCVRPSVLQSILEST